MPTDPGFVHVDYPVLQLAVEAHTEYRALSAEHRASNEPDAYTGHDFTMRKGRRVRAAGVKAVVFAAGYLDYFIYRFTCTYESIEYFNRHLDSLSAVGKWVVIPKLFLGRELDQQSKGIVFLKRLVQARNRIVHPRLYPVGNSDKAFENTASDADNFHYCASRSIPGMVSLLREIRALNEQAPLCKYTNDVINFCVGHISMKQEEPNKTLEGIRQPVDGLTKLSV